MQDIENIAITNYTENMNFFKKEHESLHRKLLAFEVILEEGRIEKKYDLEYKNGYFDVLELNSNFYLYNTNSELYSDKQAEEITFKKSDQVFQTQYKFHYTGNGLAHIKESDPYMGHATQAELIQYYTENIDSSMNMNQIDKFIFIGVGLALHLPKIIKKTSAGVILIIENNIELFRLSLFTCNYKKMLEGNKALFVISSDPLEITATFNSFFEIAFIRNHLLKFSIFSSNYEWIIKEIQKSIIVRPEKCYSHSRLLEKSKFIMNRLNKHYKYLDISKKSSEIFFDDKPILVIGGGPSLQKEIQWLKENANQFVIVAVLAAVKPIYNVGIIPDIVVNIDENVALAKREIDSFGNVDFLKNTIFVFTASVSELYFETFDNNQIYLLEDRTKYKLNDCFIDAASVGEAAYAIALAFTNKDVCLLGLDLAISDDGGTHNKDHLDYRVLDTSKTNKISENMTLDTSVLEVKGNFRKLVKTIPLLASSIPVVNLHTQRLKSSNQNIYNLSDGAFFDNTTPLRIDALPKYQTIDKKEFNKKLVQLFDKYASSEISQSEMEKLHNKKKNIASYYKMLDNFGSSPTSTGSLFMKKFVEFLEEFLATEKDELHQLLLNYTLNTATYIADFFNTKEISNQKKHTKKIKSLLIFNYKKIIKAYEVELDKLVE